MVTIRIDGENLDVPEGSRLGSVVTGRSQGCCVAVIRPGTQEKEKTENLQIVTTKGEIRVEIPVSGRIPLDNPGFIDSLKLHWEDRYSAAFGPFPSDIIPDRRPHLYERGDLILGCGGYDPKQSYLVFSRMRHSADHGAGETGGVIGKVVSGRGVLDNWSAGDKITEIIPVIAWADTTRSFTTTDPELLLEEGMQIVTHVDLAVQGYGGDNIDTGCATSVEHLLLSLEDGTFHVDRAASTHIFDGRRTQVDVHAELKGPRREGTVTIRTKGQSGGALYIYTADVPSNPAHTVVAQVVHGIEIARLAKAGEIFSVRASPPRFDLIGLPLGDALKTAAARGITTHVDNQEGDRVVVGQAPGTTLEVLAKGTVSLVTEPLTRVIDIVLDDANAPDSCGIFRFLTGLWSHDVGQVPAFFIFDDVYLFKPVIPKGVKIIPENTPQEEVPAGALAITNEARKGVGLVGIRVSSHTEFGPTSEPFEGTNIIGRVVNPGVLKNIREKDIVFIREVKG
ncbi:MAG: methanogenesis marker 3 protein [Methanoregulaceae archaeon]|jgi:putative methanogenesis marker protein 3|nr:methanogenesis marker 3 protein [Methanoregulaceae archaeon]